MVSIKNILIAGADNLLITLDIFFREGFPSKPIVIYAHGFNGFKAYCFLI